MRRQDSYPVVGLGVEANQKSISLSTSRARWRIYLPLDEHEFIRLHASEVLPLMIRVVLHRIRLTLPIRVDQVGGDQVCFRVNRTIVAQRERPVIRRMRDGPPEVDDLEAALEERRRVGRREVPMDTRNRGGSRLVDVHQRYWLSLLRGIVEFSGAATANGCESVRKTGATTQ